MKGTGIDRTDVHFEHPATYVKAGSAAFGLSDEWRLYRMSVPLTSGIAAGDGRLVFHLAHGTGTLRMSKPRLFVAPPGATFADYPPLHGSDYRGGRDDSWRAAALARIEKRRKAPLTVLARTTKGLPASDATITIRQLDSPFRWGTAVQGHLVLGTSTDADRYRQALAARFDTAVFEWEHKWHADDWIGNRIALARDAMVRMRSLGMDRFRGHTLIWGADEYMPSGFPALTLAEQRQAIRDHIPRDMNAVGGDVYVWDVVNEAVTAVSTWNRVGWDLFPESFRLARLTRPSVKLAYNENVLHDRPEAADARIRELIDAATPFDIVGDQAHFSPPLIPIPKILARWDAVAAMGKRLEITEFDCSTWDDRLQAEYVEDLALAAFSHPAMDSFLFWGFWEGAHWKAADGGHLIRRDWTPRPAMTAFDTLVKSTLRTNVTGRGIWSGRAFKGRYEIRVTRAGRTTTRNVTVDAPVRIEIRV